MDNSKILRGSVKAQLTKFRYYLQKFETDLKNAKIGSRQISELQRRTQIAEGLLEKFESIHNDLLLVTTDIVAEQEQFDIFEDSYFEAMSIAETLLNKCVEKEPLSRPVSPGSVSQSSSSSLHTPFKLPAIHLPKFNGDIENWLEFREIYISLVHDNPSISHIHKLHYLKASLDGEAALILKSLEFKSSNYDVAWEALCDRYNNSRMLAHNHFKSILDISTLSFESAPRLRKINDSMFKHVTSLKSLANEGELFEVLLIQIISAKLDPTTFREWETRRNKSDLDLPTLAEFREFLKDSADLLETLESKGGTKVTKETRERSKGYTRSLVSNFNPCALCKGPHFISGCEEFKGLSVDDRNCLLYTSPSPRD